MLADSQHRDLALHPDGKTEAGKLEMNKGHLQREDEGCLRV